jgi:hypothetical protein
MKTAWMSAVLCLALVLSASEAEAQLFSGTGGNDTIIIGMIKIGADLLPEAYGCVDNGATGTFYDLGNSSGLTATGTVQALAGNDIVYIQEVGKTQAGPTRCQVAGQVWSELLYNGHTIDLSGGDGNDYLSDGGGGGGSLIGGNNNDTMHQLSAGYQTFGNSGDDDLFGWAAGATDHLEGQQDSDCLFVSGTYFKVDCGEGGATDNDVTTATGISPVDCETEGAPSC